MISIAIKMTKFAAYEALETAKSFNTIMVIKTEKGSLENSGKGKFRFVAAF